MILLVIISVVRSVNVLDSANEKIKVSVPEVVVDGFSVEIDLIVLVVVAVVVVVSEENPALIVLDSIVMFVVVVVDVEEVTVEEVIRVVVV